MLPSISLASTPLNAWLTTEVEFPTTRQLEEIDQLVSSVAFPLFLQTLAKRESQMLYRAALRFSLANGSQELQRVARKLFFSIEAHGQENERLVVPLQAGGVEWTPALAFAYLAQTPASVSQEVRASCYDYLRGILSFATAPSLYLASSQHNEECLEEARTTFQRGLVKKWLPIEEKSHRLTAHEEMHYCDFLVECIAVTSEVLPFEPIREQLIATATDKLLEFFYFYKEEDPEQARLIVELFARRICPDCLLKAFAETLFEEDADRTLKQEIASFFLERGIEWPATLILPLLAFVQEGDIEEELRRPLVQVLANSLNEENAIFLAAFLLQDKEAVYVIPLERIKYLGAAGRLFFFSQARNAVDARRAPSQYVLSALVELAQEGDVELIDFLKSLWGAPIEGGEGVALALAQQGELNFLAAAFQEEGLSLAKWCAIIETVPYFSEGEEATVILAYALIAQLKEEEDPRRVELLLFGLEKVGQALPKETVEVVSALLPTATPFLAASAVSALEGLKEEGIAALIAVIIDPTHAFFVCERGVAALLKLTPEQLTLQMNAQQAAQLTPRLILLAKEGETPSLRSQAILLLFRVAVAGGVIDRLFLEEGWRSEEPEEKLALLKGLQELTAARLSGEEGDETAVSQVIRRTLEVELTSPSDPQLVERLVQFLREEPRDSSLAEQALIVLGQLGNLSSCTDQVIAFLREEVVRPFQLISFARLLIKALAMIQQPEAKALMTHLVHSYVAYADVESNVLILKALPPLALNMEALWELENRLTGNCRKKDLLLIGPLLTHFEATFFARCQTRRRTELFKSWLEWITGPAVSEHAFFVHCQEAPEELFLLLHYLSVNLSQIPPSHLMSLLRYLFFHQMEGFLFIVQQWPAFNVEDQEPVWAQEVRTATLHHSSEPRRLATEKETCLERRGQEGLVEWSKQLSPLWQESVLIAFLADPLISLEKRVHLVEPWVEKSEGQILVRIAAQHSPELFLALVQRWQLFNLTNHVWRSGHSASHRAVFNRRLNQLADRWLENGQFASWFLQLPPLWQIEAKFIFLVSTSVLNQEKRERLLCQFTALPYFWREMNAIEISKAAATQLFSQWLPTLFLLISPHFKINIGNKKEYTGRLEAIFRRWMQRIDPVVAIPLFQAMIRDFFELSLENRQMVFSAILEYYPQGMDALVQEAKQRSCGSLEREGFYLDPLKEWSLSHWEEKGFDSWVKELACCVKEQS